MLKLSPVRFAIGFIALIFVLAFNTRVTRADSIETFNFSGHVAPFNNIDTITGTFTLDTSNGTITAFDFTTPVVTIDAADGWFPVVLSTAASSPNANIVELIFLDDADQFVLDFETTLSSFNGDTFLTAPFMTPSGSGNVSSLFCAEPGIARSTKCSIVYRTVFTSGSATPVSATPEPSSLILLATGLLGMGLLVRRAAI